MSICIWTGFRVLDGRGFAVCSATVTAAPVCCLHEKTRTLPFGRSSQSEQIESPSRKAPRRWDCSCGVLRPCPCAGRRYTGSTGGWPRDRHLSSARCLRGDDVYDVETVEGLAVENRLIQDGTDPERPILLKLAEGGGDGTIITPQLTVGLNN